MPGILVQDFSLPSTGGSTFQLWQHKKVLRITRTLRGLKVPCPVEEVIHFAKTL